MLEGSLLKAVEDEHTRQEDSLRKFTSSNGTTTTSFVDWMFVLDCEAEFDFPGRARRLS